MNKLGKDFLRSVSEEFSKLPKKVRATYKKPSQSQVFERIMRLGIEARVFQLSEHSDIERVSYATLKDDFIKQYYRYY